MNWEEVKTRHHVKLKPYLFIEGTLKIIIEAEVERGKKEALEGVVKLIESGHTLEELEKTLRTALKKWYR